jgi:hypothetical protein
MFVSSTRIAKLEEKIKVKRLFIVGGMIAAASLSAFGITYPVPLPTNIVPCNTPLLTVGILTSQNLACQQDDKVFGNFQWNGTYDPNGIVVNGITDPGYPGNSFVDPGITFAGVFSAAPNLNANFDISYFVWVVDPNYLIENASLSITGVALSGTGFISGSEDWCAGAVGFGAACTTAGGQAAHSTVSISGAQTSFTDTVFFTPNVTFVAVTKDISIHGDTSCGTGCTPSDNTEFSRIDQQYSQNGSAVPEPVSMTLLGSGLIAFGFIGRKLRRK